MIVTPLLAVKLLLLIGVANGAPIVGRRLLGDHLGRPVDGGWHWVDGYPLFGPAKTVRGLALSLIATSLLAPLLGLPLIIGVTISVFAMLGDLFSSFIKRRLRMSSSGMAAGLDQIPECVLPLLAVSKAFELSAFDILVLTLVFTLASLVLSRLLFRLRIREHPY